MKEEIVLDLIKRYLSVYINDYAFVSGSLEVILRDRVESLGKELTAFHDLPLEPLKTVQDLATFKTPKTWFQHFKADLFPLWLLKKFPIKWHEQKMLVNLDVGAVYPQLPEVYPKNLGQIRYRYVKNSPIEYYPLLNNIEQTYD